MSERAQRHDARDGEPVREIRAWYTRADKYVETGRDCGAERLTERESW